MEFQIIQKKKPKPKRRFLLLLGIIIYMLIVVGIFCVVFQMIIVTPTRRTINDIIILSHQQKTTTTTTTNTTNNTNNNNNNHTKCSAAAKAAIVAEQQQQQQPFNVTGKGLCFIHVGKTGGGSFRLQFAKDKKIITNNQNLLSSSLPSLKQLKFWREFHTEKHLYLTKDWYTKCDYFVVWVRNPIERIISAYNMIFDPEWIEHLNKHNKKYKKQTLLYQQRILNTYGNLNNIAENLYVVNDDDDDNRNNNDNENDNNDDHDGKIININATTVLEGIEHIKHNIGWYFNSDSSGNALQPPVVATKMYSSNNTNNNTTDTNTNNKNVTTGTTTTTTTYRRRREITTNKVIVSRLSNPEFVNKLVFVGSTECYSNDILRFMKMFGIDVENSKFIQDNPIQHVHTSKTNGNFDHHISISNLSSIAIQNLRNYFSTDYDVLISLIEDYNLIHCPKLIEKVLLC